MSHTTNAQPVIPFPVPAFSDPVRSALWYFGRCFVTTRFSFGHRSVFIWALSGGIYFSGATGQVARSRAVSRRDSWWSTCGAVSRRESSSRGASKSVSRLRKCSSTTRSAGKTVHHELDVPPVHTPYLVCRIEVRVPFVSLYDKCIPRYMCTRYPIFDDAPALHTVQGMDVRRCTI